jgi:hypothetical protein
VVLGEDFWKEHLSADPGIIGKEIQIDGRPTTVVGIAAPGFRLPNGARLWVPRK